ncbi:MAG: LLM class flavin-dependent oxidoreductase [Gammaproteobacteria bacterium]
MKFGYLSVNTADGIHPGQLGKELEERGFESLWVPEHSHLPVASAVTFPDPTRVMPDAYAHMMSPYVSLAAAAATTSKLTLGTGMSVGLEHDLMDLACTISTLDVLSHSRLIAGFGVGWNVEELHNSRPELPFRQRYSALKDRIAALRAAWGTDNSSPGFSGPYSNTAWGQQISSYSGNFDRFSPSWVFPKPVRGSVPVALGLAGPLGVQHAADYADIWAPVDTGLRNTAGEVDVAGAIERFRRAVEDAGRDPEAVGITLFNITDITEAMIDHYATLPIDRFVFGPPTFMRHPASATLKRLDALRRYIETYTDTRQPANQGQ